VKIINHVNVDVNVLIEVRNILQTTQYDDIVWGSDLNWDPSRNTQFSRSLAEFVQGADLVSLWESCPDPYTHVHTDGRSRSLLDHFLLSPRLLSLVEGCGVVERGDNRSRHCPIWLKLKLGSLPIRRPTSKWVPKRPACSKATSEQKTAFKQHFETRLLQLQELADPGGDPVLSACLKCEDVHCKDGVYSEVRDSHLLDIVSAIIESSHVTLPGPHNLKVCLAYSVVRKCACLYKSSRFVLLCLNVPA
jgi:hypothetical protein